MRLNLLLLLLFSFFFFFILLCLLIFLCSGLFYRVQTNGERVPIKTHAEGGRILELRLRNEHLQSDFPDQYRAAISIQTPCHVLTILSGEQVSVKKRSRSSRYLGEGLSVSRLSRRSKIIEIRLDSVVFLLQPDDGCRCHV